MTAARAFSAILAASALAMTVSAGAQPKTRAKHAPATPPPAPSVDPRSAAGIAYMSARQPLVGWHAGSEKAQARDAGGRPMLTLSTINRGESLSLRALGDEGGFAATDLDRASHLLRAATGDEHPVDPRTLSLVYRIEVHFGVPEVRVVSGYRVPKPGSRSNHCKGRAIDLIVPGVADEEVARFAREMGFVGVGVYPTSQFVHVDVRPRSYFWVDYSGPRMKNRERGIMGDLAARSDTAATARGQVPIEPFAVALDVDAAMRARGLAATAVADEDDEDE